MSFWGFFFFCTDILFASVFITRTTSSSQRVQKTSVALFSNNNRKTEHGNRTRVTSSGTDTPNLLVNESTILIETRTTQKHSDWTSCFSPNDRTRRLWIVFFCLWWENRKSKALWEVQCLMCGEGQTGRAMKHHAKIKDTDMNLNSVKLKENISLCRQTAPPFYRLVNNPFWFLTKWTNKL